MGPSDLDLARRAGAGERDAFQQLLERHYDLIYRLGYRFFGNSADAEDVAQEICLALAGKIGAFEGRSRFSTWLYRVAVNACRDHARRQANIRALQGASVAFAEHQRADWADSEGKVRWLYEAIGTLDPGAAGNRAPGARRRSEPPRCRRGSGDRRSDGVVADAQGEGEAESACGVPAMNDELDALKQLVKRERPILPRPDSRRRAISAAVARFETLNRTARQGSPLTDRLKAAASAAREALFRRRSMRLTLALAGSASLAVLALAIINTAQLRKRAAAIFRAASAAASLRRRAPADFSADVEPARK